MISPFTPGDIDLVAMLLHSRCISEVHVEAIEAQVQLDADAAAPVACSRLYWKARGAHFVVTKVAEQRYRSPFFYGEQEQFGTGGPDCDSLGDVDARGPRRPALRNPHPPVVPRSPAMTTRLNRPNFEATHPGSPSPRRAIPSPLE